MHLNYNKLLTEDRAGVLSFGGARMALLDIEAGFWEMRRQLEALVGRQLADAVLQQAGANGGASFARSFKVQNATHHDAASSNEVQAFKDCVAAYQAAGFGRFEIQTLTWPIGYAKIVGFDTFESWNAHQHDQAVKAPICAYTAGVLVGFINELAGRKDVVCIERACAAQHPNSDVCVFELLPAADAEDMPVVALSYDPAISQQLNLLEILFERMPMGIAVFDRDLRLRRCNPTWAEFIRRYNPNAHIPVVPGAYYFDMEPGTESTVRPMFERVLSGETLHLQAFPIPSGQFTSYWDAVLTPIFEHGKVKGFIDVTTDVTEQVLTEQSLRKHVTFNKIVTHLSTNFINLSLDEIEDGINQALQTIGDFTNTDRSYVFQFSEDFNTMDCIYEWCAKGISPQIEHLQNVSVSDFAWSNTQLLQGQVLHIPRVVDLPPTAKVEKEEFEAQDIQSLLAVPMQHGGKTIGFLGFDAVHTEKTWSEQNISLLKIVGGIFVNALQRKQSQEALQRAYETLEQRVEERTREIEQRRQELESLYHADEQLYRHVHLDQVLQVLVDIAVKILDADKSSLMVWDEPHQHLTARVTHGFQAKTVRQMVFAAGEGMVGKVAASGNSAMVEDTHTAPDVARHITDPEDIRAFMHVPIKIAGQVYGVFNVNYTQPRSFGEDQLRLFSALAQRAALAIENAQLYEQAQQTAILEERNRIARELHDSVSQALYGIALGTRTTRTLLDRQDIPEDAQAKLGNPLDYVLSLADAGLAEMRALIFELRPDALKQEGLVAALQKQAQALRARHKIAVQTSFCEEPPLSFKTKEALYRVAQEALNNIVKHAAASEAKVYLSCDGQRLTLEIQDNGKGFEPQNSYPGHLGLQTMQERLSLVGGNLDIQSLPGQGTTIRASLKLPDQTHVQGT